MNPPKPTGWNPLLAPDPVQLCQGRLADAPPRPPRPEREIIGERVTRVPLYTHTPGTLRTRPDKRPYKRKKGKRK